jgi:hypothetical protein
MPSSTIEGPPWGGQYVDPDEAYLRGQTASVGSGLLGGWTQSNLGGPFGTGEPQVVAEVIEELKEVRRAVQRRQAEEAKEH